MSGNDIEAKLQRLTSTLVNELISLTPESMKDIQFEIASTDDGGADVGLLETHPDATTVALSDLIYTTSSRYLPVVKDYVPGWKRTLTTLHEAKEGWKVKVNFGHA